MADIAFMVADNKCLPQCSRSTKEKN